jgi:hypothetical protein
MRLKQPPHVTPVLISSFILHKGRYVIDRTYQRENGTWKKDDEQYFIDTILRGFAIPPIFLHEKGDKEYIVDGQQRLNTIWKFRSDRLPLSYRYSKDIINDSMNKHKNNGSGAYYCSKLHKSWQNRFDSYQVPVIYLRDYNDEEIRDLFKRLQHGKPLIPGEILNAYIGDIVPTMRKLAKHKFFTDIIALKNNRYKHYYIAAQLMYLESKGINNIGPKYIYDFFEKNENLNQDSKIYVKVNRVLNILSAIFRRKTPEIRKPAWIITLYLFTAHMLDHYAMENQKNNFRNFFFNFYQDIVNTSSTSDKELIIFNFLISRGTNSRSSITFRYEVILKRFLKKYNPVPLDENRLFSNEQKIAIFRRDLEKCQICGKQLVYGCHDTQFHHKDKYIDGGSTEINRGLLVCKSCHLSKIHGI